MPYSRDEIISQMERDCAVYKRMAQYQERAFWIGSTTAAVCSAIAGLLIAGEPESAGDLRKFLTAVLAVIPAVWAALDRTLRLGHFSAYNYEIYTELRTLLLDAQGKSLDPDTKALAKKYGRILKRENELFRHILLSEEGETTEAASEAEATTFTGPHASRAQTHEGKS